MSPEGPDFQTWSVPTSSYGSGIQQQQINKNIENKQISESISSSSSQQQQQTPSSSSSSSPSGPSISFHQQPQAFQQGSSYSGYGQYIGGQQSGGMPDGMEKSYEKLSDCEIEAQTPDTQHLMIYTLADCIPCQRAKHLLAIHYPDVRAHYLELSGNEVWQQQLQIQLQYLTGAITFPYIFVCGQYIGGGTELFELHESGQLRRLINLCLQKQTKK
uniref:Glutaredoxin domain-containing protein n=3 Tax=Meloidogyne TaxID=189290 RepID=A0A914KYA9_MELIC